jgi:hypothetical protein
MIVVDGETKPEIIAAKTRELIADQQEIAGLIGLSDTDMVLAAAKIAAERRLVFLTSGATSPLLPQQVPFISGRNGRGFEMRSVRHALRRQRGASRKKTVVIADA